MLGHISYSDPEHPGQVEDSKTGQVFGRIVRDAFPLGGWIYFSYDRTERCIYNGNDPKAALDAFKKPNPS